MDITTRIQESLVKSLMQWHPTYNRWSLKNKEVEALESKGTGFAYFETCVENVVNYCPHFI